MIDRTRSAEVAPATPEQMPPELRRARRWMEVTNGLLAARIEQYRQLGNPDANSPDFLVSQQEVLELARTMLNREDPDPGAVQFFNDLETQAIDTGQSQATYFLAHVEQLDQLTHMAENASNLLSQEG